MSIACGIVGLGKIARDQHLPALAASPGLHLAAVASPDAAGEAVPSFPDLGAMLACGPRLDAVIMCQPPQARFAAARMALLAGKHVFLEKPPGMTLGEVDVLATLADERGLTLFAGWHSRWSAGAAALQRWCMANPPSEYRINWLEDVREWHPGQQWIWQPGGFGVFDPGINALSILTAAVRSPLRVVAARIEVPQNCATPIAAELALESAAGATASARFDWRHPGKPAWTIEAVAGEERYLFDSAVQPAGHDTPITSEYLAMYAHFADLIRQRCSDVDRTPLQLVADALMLCETIASPPFEG